MTFLLIFVSFSVCALKAFGQVPPYPGAGCTFDPNCFYYAPGCGLTRCPPFNRSTPVTCNQCLQMCNEKQVGEYPYFCRAVVYDCVTKTCDMFGTDERGGAVLVKDRNKFYFKPSGQCRGTPAPAAAAPTCPSGQVAKVVQVKDHQFPGVTGQTVPGVDQAGCAQACLKNQLPGGGVFDCKSAQFKGGQCTLSTAVATAENQVQPDPGSAFFQKFCFDAASVAGCPDVFDEFPQKALIGQNRQTLDSQSLQDCIQQCLNAKQKFGFGCNSAEFYYNIKTQNCILNDETRTTRPDLFTDIKDEKVTYFETLCGGGVAATAGPGITSGPVVTGLTPAPATPGSATPGPSPVSEQTTAAETQSTRVIGGELGEGLVTLGTLPPLRFLLAEKKKQAFDKSFKDLPNSDSVCHALVYNGLKRCPIGVMSQGNRPRYCVHPVDC